MTRWCCFTLHLLYLLLSWCTLSPWVRIKWTWCARSTMALLCFSLQWLIRRVLLCGSCHFTHGYIKPVGGCSQAAVRVCVSMHDSVMKYWSVLSSTVGSTPTQFLSLNFIFSFPLLSWCRVFILPWRGVQIRKANLIWTHDRANPSQLQNEKAVWSESIPKTSMGSFSQMPVPFAALTVIGYDEKGLGRVQ